MNFKEIKELIEILDQSSLTEINIEDNKGSVVNLKTERDRNNHTTIYTTSTISTRTSTMATQIKVQQNHLFHKIMIKSIKMIHHIKQSMHLWWVHFINRHLQKKMHMFKSEIKLPMNLQCAS